jgi:hypothetical protein
MRETRTIERRCRRPRDEQGRTKHKGSEVLIEEKEEFSGRK